MNCLCTQNLLFIVYFFVFSSHCLKEIFSVVRNEDRLNCFFLHLFIHFIARSQPLSFLSSQSPPQPLSPIHPFLFPQKRGGYQPTLVHQYIWTKGILSHWDHVKQYGYVKWTQRQATESEPVSAVNVRGPTWGMICLSGTSVQGQRSSHVCYWSAVQLLWAPWAEVGCVCR